MHIAFDTDCLAGHVTEIRDIAESVRTYGGNDVRGNVEISSALHVIAARLESEMRSWAHLELTLARKVPPLDGYVQDALRFDNLKAVLTYPTPTPISVDVRRAELATASARLRAVAGQLPAALSSGSTGQYVSELMGHASAITALAG